ncbi:hypothetical protein SPRG_18991 [Saprolegnia parasitica CBS 223.65]|uniref:Uncharacterized protein n=1 Tax=Saprolegnia parasitica (strain CBS 223.65) TaxID=695850 RepID=A0A067CXX4_SAPPC|nr:hypothetical protein SPRG_18991 [Saprolegnia parasitica CBS 223.65]KDO34105.1 hypothetical protein SPRG_18991 [Saprolegnia parasitica CBS 223.65]|eukprot:XP_012195195.1 hypothetical protein SPRG_18991 [Saprolegnia parasitica CBS 223.65]
MLSVFKSDCVLLQSKMVGGDRDERAPATIEAEFKLVLQQATDIGGLLARENTQRLTKHCASRHSSLGCANSSTARCRPSKNKCSSKPSWAQPPRYQRRCLDFRPSSLLLTEHCSCTDPTHRPPRALAFSPRNANPRPSITRDRRMQPKSRQTSRH